MTNIYLWKVTIVRESTEEFLKEIHLMGRNVLQVTHLAEHLVEDHMDDFDNDSVIISGVEKVKGIVISNFECPENGIGDLLDDDEMGEYDPEMPFNAAKRLPDDHPAIMKFKCSCKHEIKVTKSWPFIVCPECHKRINRRDVEEVGGIYLSTGNSGENEDED
jgi:hypothetical protein